MPQLIDFGRPEWPSLALPKHELARLLADLATSALLDEALLTPKPALVDQRGSGAHDDLSLELMFCSASALRPVFERIALTAYGRLPLPVLRLELGVIGRAGEQVMFANTGGVNTHSGVIWSLGLLVAGAAMRGASSPPEIVSRAGALASFPDLHFPLPLRNGSKACQRYGVSGARGEAANGFPHITDIALPTLRRGRAAGVSESHAQLDALLAIMSSLDDTCLLHRGGRTALQAAQSGARSVLSQGGSSSPRGWEALFELDRTLLSHWASPGGSADLLASTLFLDRLHCISERML